MIIWKGWGLIGLVPLIIGTIVFAATTQLGIHKRGDGPATGLFLFVLAVGFWWLGRRLNRGMTFRESRHSLYMIPLQYHAIPLAAAGVLLSVAALMAAP
jgi:hypothetical protein